MIANVRVTLRTINGKKIRLDLQPAAALDLGRALIQEVGNPSEKAAVTPPRPIGKGARK